jgi:hypothetical protein
MCKNKKENLVMNDDDDHSIEENFSHSFVYSIIRLVCIAFAATAK